MESFLSKLHQPISDRDMNDKENSKDNTIISDKKNIQAEQNKPNMSFLHLVFTTFAAAIGVQSSKNLEQDFTQKSPLPFIVAGIIFTAVFLTCVILIVKVVLSDI